MPPLPEREFVSISRSELAWLVTAIIAGAWLRLAHLDHLAVEHFDEAVYSSNLLYGAENGGQFPGRQFFAPPLLPWVIEFLQIASKGTGKPAPGWLPMLPALVCGIAMIPSLWWVGRQWFSASSGIAAAWLVALCEFHAAYSRTALTDVPLTLFLLWAVYWFHKALAANSKWFAISAGAFTAAAWWTKYNGWLAITIAAAGAGLFLLITRASGKEWLRKAAVCTIGATIALILWSPVLWDCEAVGGYLAVAANHRGYIEGWSAWLKNAKLQFNVHGGTYAGWITAIGICGPTVFILVTEHPAIRRLLGGRDVKGSAFSATDAQRLFWIVANSVLVAVYPPAWFPMIIGVSIVCSALALRRAVREGQADRALAISLLLAWIVGLVITTPLYRPYPRLTLPLAVGSLLAGSVIWRRGWAPFASTDDLTRRVWVGPALLLTTAFLIAGRRGSIVWEDRTFYQAAARQLEMVIRREDRKTSTPSVVYASGEPALVYWLHDLGIPAANAANLDVQGLPGVRSDLAIGPLTRTSADYAARWDTLSSQFEEIAVIRLSRLKLSSIVMLDQDPAVQARLQADSPSITLWQRK